MSSCPRQDEISHSYRKRQRATFDILDARGSQPYRCESSNAYEETTVPHTNYPSSAFIPEILFRLRRPRATISFRARTIEKELKSDAVKQSLIAAGLLASSS